MKETEGICRDCGEHTDATDSCCGAAVWIEGGWVYPEENETEESQIEST